MYMKKDYNKIELHITYDELKFIIDGLKALKRKTNPKSIKAAELWELILRLTSILDTYKKY